MQGVTEALAQSLLVYYWEEQVYQQERAILI